MTGLLMVLAGTGLLGCFGAAMRIDSAGPSRRANRRLSRPRSSTLVREIEA